MKICAFYIVWIISPSNLQFELLDTIWEYSLWGLTSIKIDIFSFCIFKCIVYAHMHKTQPLKVRAS
jgi:hypothetical protein